MRFAWLLLVFGACMTVSVDETTQEAICQTCGDGGGSGPAPACSATCDTQEACSTTCTDANGALTTCGASGVCRTCASYCTSSVACQGSCKTATGAITDCGAYGTCHKFDVYCAYPVILDDGVSDNHESSLNGPNGYMYFGSAGGEGFEKTGTYASYIGGNHYDPQAAWASNFRGPVAVTGESSRTQWEFSSDVNGSSTAGMYADWGAAGTPYRYGQQCVAVTAGTAAPTLTRKTEYVYEDDECWLGICNSDDYVGSFTIDRAGCNADVFGRGALTGWSAARSAALSGDVSYLGYKMWCYACRNAQSATCSTGVQN